MLKNFFPLFVSDTIYLIPFKIFHLHLQTLHRMYIVNAGPGFKFLWPAAQKFLDAKTIAKIHVRFCSIYFYPVVVHFCCFEVIDTYSVYCTGSGSQVFGEATWSYWSMVKVYSDQLICGFPTKTSPKIFYFTQSIAWLFGWIMHLQYWWRLPTL